MFSPHACKCVLRLCSCVGSDQQQGELRCKVRVKKYGLLKLVIAAVSAPAWLFLESNASTTTLHHCFPHTFFIYFSCCAAAIMNIIYT